MFNTLKIKTDSIIINSLLKSDVISLNNIKSIRITENKTLCYFKYLLLMLFLGIMVAAIFLFNLLLNKVECLLIVLISYVLLFFSEQKFINLYIADHKKKYKSVLTIKNHEKIAQLIAKLQESDFEKNRKNF